MLRIAIDIREAARGKKAGKGWYTYQIVEELLKQDKQNIYFLYTDQPFPKWAHFKNAEQRFFPPSSFIWHFRTLRDLKKIKPDIYFAPTSYIIPAFAPPFIKMVLTVHDLVAWISPGRHQKKATFIERQTLPLALKKAHHVLTVSENSKNELQRLLNVNQEKITVIPCAASDIFRPIDRKELENFSTHMKLPQKFILSVGTIEPRKNYTVLLESFAQLRSKYPDLHLIIIGAKGWYYREIFNTLENLKLQNTVHFPEYVSEENLVKYYNLAEMLVYPSLYEGFGMPPLEAMKSGCPVITSNVSALPEVVGDAALLVNPQNKNDIAETMEKLLLDKELKNKLQQKGIEQARKFSWEKSASMLLKIFFKVMA